MIKHTHIQNMIYLFISLAVSTVLVLLTYKGESRIDLFFDNTEIADIIAKPNTEISYPQWCKTDNGYCATIEKRNTSIYYKQHKFAIKVHKTGNIKFAIRGVDKRINGKRYPVYNDYKDITINGEKIANNKKIKKVWHDAPYSFETTLKKGEILFIKYKNRWRLQFGDWIKLTFLCLTLAGVIFAGIKYFITRAKNKLVAILNKDWIAEIKNFYQHIDSVYKNSFWTIYTITNIVFLLNTVTFFFANHDWEIMVNGQSVSTSFFEGRYGAYIVSGLVTGNLYLPIISHLWAFLFLTMSSILLAIYWKIPHKVIYFVTFSLILNISPYVMAWLWFPHCMVNVFFGRMIIILGLIFSAKYALTGTRKQKFLGNILAITCLNFGISIYQSFIGTIAIVFAGRILIEILECGTFKEGIKISFCRYKMTMFNIIIGIALYELIFVCMKACGLIRIGFYNMNTIALSEIGSKAFLSMQAAWHSFTDFSMPFWPTILTKLFLIFAIVWIVEVLADKKKGWLHKVIILAMFTVTLFLTKITAFISSESPFYTARIEFCGYALFNALIVALNFNTGKFKSMKILFCCGILYIFMINCYWAQRTNKLGFDAEKMMWNRMAARIENNPNFDYKRQYTIIHIGWPIATRWKFYPALKHFYYDDELIKRSFIHEARPMIPLIFYQVTPFAKYRTLNDFTNPEYMQALKRLNNARLLEKAKSWPANNSIIIYEDIILFVTDENDLNLAKQLLKEKTVK